MSLPSLQLRPISTSHYYTSGDVTIEAGVAIAPGVLIQADPGSQIIIKTGACIGIGAILHAYQGRLEVGEGANIGAEVLLVGQVTIGANACLGAATTVFNGSVEWGQIIPPGSLIGDLSRHPEELRATDTVVYPTAGTPSVPSDVQTPAVSLGTPDLAAPGELAKPEDVAQPSGMNVYGQVYVNQLLVKLFPNSPRRQGPPDPIPPVTGPEDPWAD